MTTHYVIVARKVWFRGFLKMVKNSFCVMFVLIILNKPMAQAHLWLRPTYGSGPPMAQAHLWLMAQPMAYPEIYTTLDSCV